MMYKILTRIALIFGLLLTTMGFGFAQDDEEELPEVPYYRARSGFNVPVLELEGWDNQSTRDEAHFVNEALGAEILVMAASTLDDDAAIQEAAAMLYDGELPDPLLESRIGVSNGTWTQQLFSIDDVSMSAMALVRGDRTFVIVLYEDSADYDVYHFAVRSPQLPRASSDEEPQTDFLAGIDLAMTSFLGDDANFEIGTQNEVTSLGLPAEQTLYAIDADEYAVFALEFDGITYATIGTGDIATDSAIGEAINTTFLGFFITPDNDNYLYLALGAVAFIFIVLIGSMWIRYTNAQKDMALVEELASKD